MPTSIFLDFSLPNATTWFYFSAILAVALFLKFNRLMSVRNWDVLALFVMVPGLLLVQEGHERRREVQRIAEDQAAMYALPSPGGVATIVAAAIEVPARQRRAAGVDRLWWGYVALLLGSTYWLARCVLDLTLIRRPALPPNLNFAGMAWFAFALYLSLGAAAIRRPLGDESQVGPASAVLQEAQARTANIVQNTTGQTDRERVRNWIEKGLAGLCHLLVIAALVLIGYWHFGDAAAGMACATAYLLLPYISFHMTQVHHVLPTAFLLWAVVAYRRPRTAGVLVGVAAGGFGFPALTVPVWLSFYKGRGTGRFLTSFIIAAGISMALAGVVMWLNGRFDLKIPTTLNLPALRSWRLPDAEGFWTGVHWAYRIPVFIATIAFVIATAFWPSPKDLGQLLALSAAHLIAAQLWYAQRGGVYVLWYLPIVLLIVFRPNLSDRFAPDLLPDVTDATPSPDTKDNWNLLKVFHPLKRS